MIRIIFYRKKCIGCGGCVEAAPQRWSMSKKDGKSVLLFSIEKKSTFQVMAEDDEFESNIAAAANCPAGIIKIHPIVRSQYG